jgi:hypothetical protein
MATVPPCEGSGVPWSCAIWGLGMSKALFVLASAILLSALGGGCTKKEAPPEEDTPCTVSSADSVGIPECDTYLCKSEACFRRSKPAAAKSMVKAERDSFRIAAGSAAGKSGAVKAMCVSKLQQLAANPACAAPK